MKKVLPNVTKIPYICIGKENKLNPKNTRKMNTITRTALYNLLINAKGCTMVAYTYVAEMVKSRDYKVKGNPFVGHTIQKVVKVRNAQFNYGVQGESGYERAVNNHLENQGNGRTFTTGHLPWGTWDVFNKTISHNGRLYVRMYRAGNYAEDVVCYLIDGRPMTDSERATFETFVSVRNTFSPKQANEGLVTKQVMVETPRLEDLYSISIGGDTYEVMENSAYATLVA